MVGRVCDRLKVSERRACRVLGQARNTQRRNPQAGLEESRLVAEITKSRVDEVRASMPVFADRRPDLYMLQ